MRISVQLRLPGEEGGLRWRRSVYVDERAREVRIPLSEMRPVEADAARLDVRRADAVLFVVDTVNADPGASGRVEIEGLRVAS
jgi:hypothetical protein